MMRTHGATSDKTVKRLSTRERDILRLVVKHFVHTAGPVGSRNLATCYPLGLSPASIRNTMSELEERGYLDHPYTSAGRIPTELGYRTFVDELMEPVALPNNVRYVIRRQLGERPEDAEEAFRIGSRLLGEFTRLLGVVLSPRLATGVLERLEVVPLSSERVMFVLSLRGGLIRTMIFPLGTERLLQREELARIVSMLNERLAGLTLEEIRRTCGRRIQGVPEDPSGIVHLLVEESADLFREVVQERKVVYGGTGNLVAMPEFSAPEEVRGLMEMLENESALLYLLEDEDATTEMDVGRVHVRIGSENRRPGLPEEQVRRYSVVSARYRLGDTFGTIGVVGPTRMDYEQVVAFVEAVARYLSHPSDVT